MSAITLPDFKIRYVLTALLYLVTCVTLIQSVNYFGVWLYGLEFLNWWPLGQAMLFGLGGTPDSILNLNTSGLAIELAVPGLEAEFQQHWLARAGLALVTTGLFLVILFTMRQMLVTLDIKNPFDPANIKRVQLIIALLLVDVFGLDYLRTESMARVKTLVEQMGAPILRTDQSYQNADVHAYVLLVLLLTLVAVFRRGLILHEKQREMEKKLY